MWNNCFRDFWIQFNELDLHSLKPKKIKVMLANNMQNFWWFLMFNDWGWRKIPFPVQFLGTPWSLWEVFMTYAGGSKISLQWFPSIFPVTFATQNLQCIGMYLFYQKHFLLISKRSIKILNNEKHSTFLCDGIKTSHCIEEKPQLNTNFFWI